MGQTLEHGIYLPDEGERNCYAGLAANWQLLDGAVGTVAEHTSQIAGKAPAVHTHTKSDITDFPAYGTTAGTICEGNDSRLSDARTPVAHTHVTADVTDLLNSAHEWTGEQTFSQTIQGNAATASAFDTAKSITLKGAVTGTVSGTNSWEIATVLKTGSASTGGTVTNPYFKIASWEVNPNKYFGAILQIQNKCYPHNTGTLIISVRTKTDATFQKGYLLLNNAIGLLPSEFILCYKEVTGKVLCELYYYSTITYNGIRFSVISEGMGIQNDNSLFNTMVVYQDPTGIAALPSDYTAIQTSYGTYTQDFIPYSNNTYNLGTSTNKWKTLNSINPGALSLPKTDSSITGIETSGFSFDGTNERIPDTVNIFSNGEALMNGWLCARLAEGAGHYIFLKSDDNIGRYGICSSCFSSGIVTTLSFGINVYVPIKVGDKPAIRWAKPNGGNAQLVFYPCLGNV